MSKWIKMSDDNGLLAALEQEDLCHTGNRYQHCRRISDGN